MKLGSLKFDAIEYGSRANAVVGIRDSGKSYTGTLLAEQLMDSGMPIIALDPAGIWRFLRVPGAGKGYPVVVVGGDGADIPLKAATIGQVVLSALQGGVSLVIDFTGVPSKADMRRIVKDTVDVLMKHNKNYGLRHVFIEEAAEFVPQKVRDGHVYEAVERLVRIGGNMGLGVTMINPRTQNLNKEVLELCENIILHRQLGKNSLENLHGWFEARGLDEPKELSQSVAGLASGQAVVWLSTSTEPATVKVQQKNSMHPDRRDTKATTAALRKQVDAGQFINGLLKTLPAVEAEIKANDPTALKAEIARLTAELKKKPVAATGLTSADETRIRSEGWNAGWAGAMKESAQISSAKDKVINKARAAAVALVAMLPEQVPSALADRNVTSSPPKAVASIIKQVLTGPHPISAPPEGLSGRHMRIINALAWWGAAGQEMPTRSQVAGVAKYAPGNGNFNNLVGALKTQGLVEYPTPGTIKLTADGAALAEPQQMPTTEALHDAARAIVSGRHAKILNAVLSVYPTEMTRQELADASGYQPGNGNFNNLVGKLKTLDLVTYPIQGQVKAADWLFLQ